MTCRTQSLLLILLLLMLPGDVWAWPARVVQATDGDTITVEPENGGERVKVRLHGIDAPELRQPSGETARAFVHTVALYEVVDIQEAPQKRDRYGRTVAVVFMPDGESLQAALLRAGLAWIWPKYCTDCDDWQELQDAARTAGRGLWGNDELMPPWEWRKRKRGS